jgi:hypothetical protein
MVLENTHGNLMTYTKLKPGTFQHSDEIVTAQRSDLKLRRQTYFTADGSLFDTCSSEPAWAITRLEQNLLLQHHIGDTLHQLSYGEYFPNPDDATASLEHEDTIVVPLRGLELKGDNDLYGKFKIDPKKPFNLNENQLIVARRVFGLDDENYALNMEMYVEEREDSISICSHMPEYVGHILSETGMPYFQKASWLGSHSFDGRDPLVEDYNNLRGELLGK